MARVSRRGRRARKSRVRFQPRAPVELTEEPKELDVVLSAGHVDLYDEMSARELAGFES
jgi:hypothetical protein